MGAIALTSNPTHHIKVKHVGMNYHFVREKVEAKTLEVKFIYALPRVQFSHLCFKLTVEVPLSLLGVTVNRLQ